ncbi:EGF-like domain containing protein [Nitzschia inconspicua]|uniref:EGF-like domain containing protein n=1 Tax=Nitzschia inconspicua TaxID=303405 RepID=A0A9K3L7N4_9STRA|nr:EGF-like domain containing protein [Nitzschia inconspicua]
MVIRCLFKVLVVLLSATSPEATTTNGVIRNKRDACTLNCPATAPCRFGAADFSGHVMELGETVHNGMHCDCPMGWTGLFCDKRFEACDNQAGHTCYHGGKCVPGLEDKYGNEQLFCDCSEARGIDGTKYVGKYCETPFEQICNPGASDDDLIFCVNGGECNPNFPETSSHPCVCDDGWSGFHCEFKEGTVPDCTLDCQNGGVCLVGVASLSEAEHMNHKWSLGDVEDHMRCACPPGVGGELCEAPAEECGDGICLHGGACVTTTHVDQNGKHFTQHHCDCTAAGDNKGNFFAGKFCEHIATSMCSETDWNLFCTQGGECKINPIEGCRCPIGTAGYKCEFLLDNLHVETQDNYDVGYDDPLATRCGAGYCQNGGVCVIEEIISGNGTPEIKQTCDCSMSSINGVFFGGVFCQYRATSSCGNGNFCLHHGICLHDGTCECPKGWTGKHCEAELAGGDGMVQSGDSCGDAFCYNGGTCAETEMIGPDGSLEVTLHCDCSSAFDDKYSYAGINCQFPSTSLCTQPSPGDDLGEVLYCVNHGTCMDDPRLGCDCPPGFYGFSCEYESQDHDTDGDGIPDLLDEVEDDQGDWEVCGEDGLVCYNGGRCQTTVMQNEENGRTETTHQCDCQTAVDKDTIYMGVACEYPATTVCDPADDGEVPTMDIVCTNHGTCKQNSNHGCDCPDGFQGEACQFKKDFEDIVVVEAGEDPVNYEECGDGLFCLNGGRCTTTILAGNGGETTEITHCDCSTAFDETEIFAGASCEHKATSLCAPIDGSLGNVHFCTNGGVCPTNSLMMPCKCDTAWQGFHCEFAVDPADLPGFRDGINNQDDFSCNLPCENGGICANGVKDLGPFQNTVSDVSHLNQTFDKDHFAHCVCPEGFVGLKCQHKVEVCGNEEHVCLHGSTCVENEAGEYTCDCSLADEIIGSKDKPVFAGNSCQYTGTDICTIGDDYPGKPLYFCVNGGICNAQVTPDQPDPGCSCPDDYIGSHCEQHLKSQTSPAEVSSPNRGTVLISGTVVAAIIAVTIAFLFKWQRSSTENDELSSKGSGTPFPRRRRRKAGYGGSNLASPNQNITDVASSKRMSISDPIASGFALPPDDEPEPRDDTDGIMKETTDDQPNLVEVGQPQDVDESSLDNVNFV